jgi:hypothetical protein
MIMYKLIFDAFTNKNIGVIRLADQANIPFDPDNVDFQQYQKWLSEGNTPIPADEPNA